MGKTKQYNFKIQEHEMAKVKPSLSSNKVRGKGRDKSTLNASDVTGMGIINLNVIPI